MKRKVVIAIALLVSSNFSTHAQANPITAPACRDIPSCVVTGTVVIGGVVYYLIKNTVTGVVRRVPARLAPPAHRNNEQFEERSKITNHAGECHEWAEQETQRTGRQWRVKRNTPRRGTGLIYTTSPLKWDCTITDIPEGGETEQ